MKLQQVKLSGFKSFVESTLIQIHGQLVGIVGPNGCGKSNVIDAVRWVLGESSAKQLRGESMADVIFNGSIKRKPVSRATVELVFDNSQKGLHGLWNNYNEISIKRLISRQGESIYSINNQQVRRKDIAELFLGTGVGSKGYAVIEQGMISRIIESRPEDMRLFLEEAAGVSKYRERRKETLGRLADTRENLLRLEDIHSELIKQLTSLQEQAKVAELHQALSAELKTTQLLISAIKIQAAEQTLNEAQQLIQHCEAELQVLGYKLEEVNLELSTEQEHKQLKEQLFNQLMEQFNDYRTSLARVEERFKHYSDLLQRFENESFALNEQIQHLQVEIGELELQIILLEERDASNQEQLSEQLFRREAQQLVVDSEEESYAELAAQLSNHQAALNDFKHQIDLLKNSLQHKRQQQANLETRLARLSEEGNTLDLDQNYHFIKEEIEIIAEDLLTCEVSHEAKSHALVELAAKLEPSRAQLALVQQQAAATAGKIATLETLLQLGGENANPLVAVQELPELWQLISVAEGYAVAVEVALGVLLQAQVLDEINLLTQEPQSAQALWLVSTVTELSEVPPKQANSLLRKVQINDPRLSGLADYLARFSVMENWYEHAKLAAGEYGVTLDGHLLTRDYVVFFANQQQNNLLQQQEQLQSERTQELLLSESLSQLNRLVSELLASEQELKNDAASLAEKQKRLLLKKHDLQLEFTKQEQIFVQNQRHQSRVSEESRLLRQEIEHLQFETSEWEIQLEDKQLAYADLALKSQELELTHLDRSTALQLTKNKLHELEQKSNQLIIDNQLLHQQKTSAERLVADKREQMVAAEQKLTELNAERQSFNRDNQAQELIDRQQQIAAVAQEIQTVQQQIDVLSHKVIGLKNQASALNSSYQRNLEQINQTKFKQQEQQILLSTYHENLAGMQSEVAALGELLSRNLASLSELAARGKELELQVATLGLVNLKAIEDLALASGKQQELFRQIEDLQQAVISLDAAIEHIDGETRKLMQTTFEQLNAAIVVYFRTLFGGGSARLALTEKDILSAGLQIFAEPPGKKNSTIHLLSGGEKALAAMSFIFALFSLNPAPFCLLDEVDAPLDDANTQRFCNLMRELSAKTQFVYISHNRLAMEMADQLVGVTMQEKGVSTVVSVSLVDAVKHANSEKAELN